MSQKNFSVRLYFPEQFDLQKIHVDYDNGKQLIERTVTDYNFEVNGIYHSKYVNVLISFSDTNLRNGYIYKSFWISEKPAEIHFAANNRTDKLETFSSSNIFTAEQMGQNLLDSFTKKEYNDFADFMYRNGGKVHSNPQLEDSMMEKGKQLRERMMLFIEFNPNLYYSLWLFQKELSHTRYLSTDTLTHFFESTFSDSIKQTFEGKEIIQILSARKKVKKTKQVPLIMAKDISGKTVFSTSENGKFKLIQFWASWCKPCLQELPIVKTIVSEYAPGQLDILSINLDSDVKNCQAVINKINLTWPQVFGNTEFVTQLNVTAIPRMFLIDLNNKIVYDSEEDWNQNQTPQQNLEQFRRFLKQAITGS